MFSTPKSKKFVNGILDKLLGEFEKEGKVKKEKSRSRIITIRNAYNQRIYTKG